MDGVGAVPLERTEWTLVELDGAAAQPPALIVPSHECNRKRGHRCMHDSFVSKAPSLRR